MILAALIVLSFAWGVGALWLFRRFTNPKALTSTVNCVIARMLEIQLFAEEPRVVIRALAAVFRENGRLLRIIAAPALLTVAAFVLLYPAFDAAWGARPVSVGDAVTVALTLRRSLSPADASITLEPPENFTVETSAVRSAADREIAWRVRALRPSRGILLARGLDGAIVASRQIAAGEPGSSLAWQKEPVSLLTRPSQWIEVDYPRTDVRMAGIALPWEVWFFAISALGAMVFIRR